MDLESELREYIVEHLVDGGGEVSVSDSLLGAGKIDSLGLMRLLAHIQQRFKVDLMAVGNPDDFESIQSLAGAIRRLTA